MSNEITRRIDCIWYGMIRRCYSPNLPQDTAIYYRDKGITVCSEWKDSREKFREWALSNGYEIGLTIDRIDSDGDYCPENCQWLTKSENSKKANAERKRLKNEYHKHLGQWMVAEKIELLHYCGRTYYGYKVLETGLYKSEAIKKADNLNREKPWQCKYTYSPTLNYREGDIVNADSISNFLRLKAY